MAFRRHLILLGCLGGLLASTAACGGPDPGSPASASGPHVITGTGRTGTTATLDVVTGTTAVYVSARSLGGDLYRISTPPHSGIRPLATRHGSTVQVGQAAAAGRTGIPTLDVVLARGVRWIINLDGGATTENIDMAHGSLSGLTFGAGVSMASVQLPAPSGTETVRLAGGATQLVVGAPPGAPAQVAATGGASQVLLDGVSHTGVAGGSVFTESGWAGAHDRYEIALTSGVSDFRMTRT